MTEAATQAHDLGAFVLRPLFRAIFFGLWQHLRHSRIEYTKAAIESHDLIACSLAAVF
jgi:hypothetical protein